jgi:GNAT superfamily N-acetyltransferase
MSSSTNDPAPTRRPLTFRKADPSDFEAVERLRLEATAWLASKGLDQWQPGTVRHPTPAGTQDAIDRGACFLVYEGDELVGTVTLDDRADAEFWTAAERREPALYLHRMIVARRAAGRDIGGAILRWAENIARRGGYRWLRLDAWRTNIDLHSYYRRHGLKSVRTVNLSHRGSGALFAKQLWRRNPRLLGRCGTESA